VRVFNTNDPTVLDVPGEMLNVHRSIGGGSEVVKIKGLEVISHASAKKGVHD
jgi:hypothetical protein